MAQRRMDIERRPLGPTAYLGIAIVALSTLGIVLDFAAPWGHLPALGGLFDDNPPVHRDDIAVREGDPGAAYLRSITEWPLYAWLGGMAAGGVLVAVGLVAPALPAARRLETPAAAALFFFGALLLIAKMRFFAQIWSPFWYGGEAIWNPGIASIFHLLGALLFLIAGQRLLAKRLARSLGVGAMNFSRPAAHKVAILTCIGVLAALALLPVFPFAGADFTPPNDPSPVTEPRLARAADGQGELATAGAALGTMRTFLWAAFVVSLTAAAAGILARAPGRARRIFAGLAHAQLAVVVLLLLALGHGIVHFVALWRAIDTLPLFNWLPVLAPLALLALQLVYLLDAAAATGAAPTTQAAGPPTGRPQRRAAAAEEDIEEVHIGSTETNERSQA